MNTIDLRNVWFGLKVGLIALTLVATGLSTGCAIEEDVNDSADVGVVIDLPGAGTNALNPAETDNDSDDSTEEETQPEPEPEEEPIEEECDDTEEPTCELPSEDDVLGHRPFVSYASLPTSTLTNGTVVHGRITITADASQDVAIRQLTFHVLHSGVNINLSSNLREIGLSSYLDRTESTHCLTALCNEYEVTLTLREDVWIAAGTSISFDLITTVTDVSSGHWIETSFVSDGTLVSACELEDDGFNFGISGTIPNLIWTDEAGHHHSGAGITPFGPMTLFAP